MTWVQMAWPISAASALLSWYRRQIDQISGAYRSTRASRACLSPFAGRVIRTLAGGSSLIEGRSFRVGARRDRSRCSEGLRRAARPAAGGRGGEMRGLGGAVAALGRGRWPAADVGSRVLAAVRLLTLQQAGLWLLR